MALHCAALRDWVCLEARGDDAAVFLHGQLSQAVADLDTTHAPLAGWADARGRIRALLRVCRQRDRWLLMTPRDGADDLVKKLRMFVLRAKVTIDVAADFGVAAVLGNDDAWFARRGIPPETAPNRLVSLAELTFVRIGPSYWQVLGTPAALDVLAAELTATNEAAAALAEIELGIPAITKALGERFVAQMLNLDELDAVSFDKGCYPGQEIIARVHNLGGVKRRARRYEAAMEPPAPGTLVLAAEAAVGEVVRSAAAPSGCELLAVVDHAAADRALTCNGAALRELPLPFAIPSD